ncbi:Nbs-lrr resistance protein [Rhynchospora pubera]|uniref:Nbs-lrr resistance protein n=1 Tax=Rhynchospora pubera TaxID=906938 RepID=A0AAV8G666_9POAL|nr:Nbs-lrr resistance protein [Rhynchospora pubera]
MAHVLLTGVLTKLAQFAVESTLSVSGIDDVIKKLKSLYDTRGEVEKLHRELMYILDFVRDSDQKQVVDRREMRWMQDVMDIAYRIEDAVDNFLFKCPKKLSGLKAIPKNISKIPFLYKFRDEINEIQDRIREIHEYKTKYEINILGEKKIKQFNPELKLDLIGNPKAIGLEAHIDNVVKNLLDDENKNLAVVSVVGIGGLGKTTLARKVCNSSDIEECFGEPIWITISQKYDLHDILRKIADKLSIETTGLDGNRLANLIWKSLQERRIWVAEQLIPLEERRTLEETAECFLEDLVQRNMVQVSERFPDGSIKYCRLHDVMSDLAILKAKEINFLMSPKRQRPIADTVAKPLLEQAPASRFCSSPPWLVLGDKMLPTHLTELRLEGYEFASDPMPVLEKLESLNSLWIHGTSRKTDYPISIRCSAKGFKQLEKLMLKELILKEWIIAAGALPMLKRLTVMFCPGLSMPTGINLERLQYLKWEANEGTNNLYKQRPNLRTWDDHDFED